MNLDALRESQNALHSNESFCLLFSLAVVTFPRCHFFHRDSFLNVDFITKALSRKYLLIRAILRIVVIYFLFLHNFTLKIYYFFKQIDLIC